MTFLLGIVSIFLLLQGLYWLGVRMKQVSTVRARLRLALAAMFMISGSMHFANPDGFVAMMPPFLPFPLVLVYLSGGLEVLGALGLLISPLQRMAGFSLVLLLLAVFPANIYAAYAATAAPGALANPWYLWLRLPLQAVYIILVWWSISDPKLSPSGTECFAAKRAASRF